MEVPKDVPHPPVDAPIDALTPEAVEDIISDESSVPAIVASAFSVADPPVRARVLTRLLKAVGPMALAVLGGGAFASYVQQARWSGLSVSLADAARTSSHQVYELALYVQQSNPEVARQILAVLSRDVATMTAMGATVGAMMLTFMSGRKAKKRD